MAKQGMLAVGETVKYEGFAYAFLDYSGFEDVQDEEFHRLRKNFVRAARELGEYIGMERLPGYEVEDDD